MGNDSGFVAELCWDGRDRGACRDMAYDKSGSHLKNFCENHASQEEQRIMKVIELIFVAPWVFVIAVACIEVLRDFWMDVRSYFGSGLSPECPARPDLAHRAVHPADIAPAQ